MSGWRRRRSLDRCCTAGWPATRRNSTIPRHDPIVAGPTEPGFGRAAWPVFAADPAAVTDAVERGKYRGIVHFAFVWLVPRWYRRDLHMADHGHVLFEARDEITADDLGMIEVELDAHVRPLHLGDDVGGVLGPG